MYSNNLPRYQKHTKEVSTATPSLEDQSEVMVSKIYESVLRMPPNVQSASTSTTRATSKILAHVSTGTSDHLSYETENATFQAKSEFMIVDLMDQMMFTMQHMGALLPNQEMESACLGQFLNKETLLELVDKEIKDREMQQRQYELEVEYYKSKVLASGHQVQREELALRQKQMEMKMVEFGVISRQTVMAQIERQRQVIKLAQILFDDEAMIDICCEHTDELYPFLDVPNMFMKAVKRYCGHENVDVYDMVNSSGI